ncbi:AAA family ATPase [Bosea sp. CS1GBMeth4]|uniref:AAA family ATPase n=1 Tax=Bosea sp. CS1GBMeth4 TaxID=1892849 RepID=UPI0016491A79|nr:AAA family ATPase [Bosea sp. CS1GBMeth4]
MAPRAKSALRLTRLKVRNWRNFREVEVRLGKRAIFVGPNASGKSNLLDAIRFLRDLVKPVGGGLAAAVEERGGIPKLRSLYARGTRTDVVIDVDVGDDEDPLQWSYRLSFTRIGKDNFASVTEEVVRRNGEEIASQRRSSADDQQKLAQTLIQQAGQNAHFRGLVEFFESIRYLHIVPQIMRDSRRALEKGEDPYGGDLLERINATPPKTRNARLRRISEALRIAVPQFVNLELEVDKRGSPHLKVLFKHWRPNPTTQNESQLSDGTLRLIGFLWSTSEREGPLLLEEPELSLHEDVARQLPAMIARMQRHSGRQVLMTTHSEAIAGEPGIGTHEVFRLEPGENGTTAEMAADNKDVMNMVEAGFTVGEAVMPMARPKNINQLSLFDVVSG